MNKQQLNHLNKALLDIDKQILQLVKQQAVLNKQYELLTSIPGIGKQTALYLIITTRSFRTFKTWRQIACYALSVPFLSWILIVAAIAITQLTKRKVSN